jgi:ankyrin repeat protein
MEHKYLKYKKKYLIIKDQIGNGIEDYRAPTCYTDEKYRKKIVGCNINFTNKLGSCWVIAILVIFLYSDSSSKCVQNILNTIPVEDIIKNPKAIQLLECSLPDNIIDSPYKDKLKLLIGKLKEKFDIKIEGTVNIPDVTEKEFIELYFNIINNTSRSECGGLEYHNFFLINILSSLFLNKLIELNNFGINKLINLELLKNTIGIMISMPKHVCSFYICSNKMKFCNNSLIIDYNWLKLFETCNSLKLQNINYNIYINKLNIKGPFIYTNNKIIYFDKDKPYIKKKYINYNNNDQYFKIDEFQFICYKDNEENYKKINNVYYLQYHTYVYDIIRYKEFITKYNISINDINKPITTTNDTIITLLNIACSQGRFDIVELLLGYRDINVTGSLHFACINGHIEIIKLLLQHHNININKTIDYKGIKTVTPLHIACKRGRFEIVKLLLQYRYINVNSISEISFTPLYIACYEGHYDIVELLLQHRSIDINKGTSPLYIACLEGFDDIVELLLRHRKVNKVNEVNKVNVNKVNEMGFSPLYIACNEGHFNIVYILLQQPDIKINIQDNDNESPLHIACDQEHVDIVELLLQQPNININIQNNDNDSPLHIACDLGYVNIVELLLQQPNININIRNKKGETPLFIACDQGHADIVELLLQRHDIEINIRNNKGDTSLLIATKNNRIDIIELLNKYLK